MSYEWQYFYLFLEVVSNAIDAGDDEILMVIAQKLGSFGDLVGGAEHISLIVVSCMCTCWILNKTTKFLKYTIFVVVKA